MKLSEAIREGCKFGPQIDVFLDGKGGSCAIGAAMQGYCGEPLDLLKWTYHPKANQFVEEMYGSYEKGTFERMMRWNDQDGLSREAIAALIVMEEAKMPCFANV